MQAEEAAVSPGQEVMLLRETGQPHAAAELGENELSGLP